MIVVGFDHWQTISFAIGERQRESLKELNIVIAEDSELFRNVLQQTLSDIDGFNIIGTVANGVDAVRVVKELKPHVLILDITMPIKNGIEVLKEIREEDSSPVVIMFTADPDPFVRKLCLETGARYFLNKFQVVELIRVCKLELLTR